MGKMKDSIDISSNETLAQVVDCFEEFKIMCRFHMVTHTTNHYGRLR